MRQRTGVTDIIIFIALSLWGLIILYPFYNCVVISLVPQYVYLETPFMLFPRKVVLQSYQFVFSSELIRSGFIVTGLILVIGTVYNMVLSTLTAYAINKKIPGQKAIRLLVIFTMYFNGGLIPFYLLIQKLGLINSIFSMILPTGINVSYMLIISFYFKTLPHELEDSAKIDGANDMLIFFKIMLPLALPILATFTLYYSVDRWNEWYYGMLFVRKAPLMPLQLVLRNIVQDADAVMRSLPSNIKRSVFSDGVKMASIIVTVFPVMCIYPFVQRYFVAGLTVGAVKS